MEGSEPGTVVRTVNLSRARFDWPRRKIPDEFGICRAASSRRRLKIAAYDFGMKWKHLCGGWLSAATALR